MPAAEVLPGFIAATVLMVVVPGPDMAFIVGAGLGGGRRAGVLSALGMAVGMLVHTAAAALGVGALLAAAPGSLVVIRLLGAGYLAWLAVTTLRGRRHTVAVGGTPSLPARTLLRRAVLTNVTNPKIVLFFLAFLPQFIRPGRGPETLQFVVLGLLFLAVGLVVDSAAGFAAGQVGALLGGHSRLATALPVLSAAAFAGIAGLLLVEVVDSGVPWL